MRRGGKAILPREILLIFLFCHGIVWTYQACGKGERALVYYMDLTEHFDDAMIDALLAYVSFERRVRAETYLRGGDRVRSVLAFLLLRIGLYREYGITQMPQIAFMPKGKPYLADWKDIRFNLSHCKTGVACAVSDGEVGVDIQHYVPFNASIAERIMTADELLEAQTGDADAVFTRLWSLMESEGKFTGDGVSLDLTQRRAPERCLRQSYMLEHFALSVTSEKPLALVKLCAAELPALCRPLLPASAK